MKIGRWIKTNSVCSKAGEKGEITFSKSLENGLKILKRFKFTSDQYTIDLEVEVQNNSSKEITNQLGLEWIGKIELGKAG